MRGERTIERASRARDIPQQPPIDPCAVERRRERSDIRISCTQHGRLCKRGTRFSDTSSRRKDPAHESHDTAARDHIEVAIGDAASEREG